jgi:hypothetical protein
MIELFKLGSILRIVIVFNSSVRSFLCLGYKNLFLDDNDRLLIFVQTDFADSDPSLLLTDNCKKQLFVSLSVLFVQFLQLVHFLLFI